MADQSKKKVIKHFWVNYDENAGGKNEQFMGDNEYIHFAASFD